MLFLGVIGAGGQFTGSNPSYTATELGHHLRLSHAKFIFTSETQLPCAQEAAAANDIPFSNIIVIEASTASAQLCTSLNSLLSRGSKDWRKFEDDSTSQSTTAALLSTSGTTGLPKMAARSHASWIAENESIEDKCPKPYQVRRLLCVPFFHAFAAPLALISALRSGHPTYVMARFCQNDFLHAISSFDITETAMPPPLIVRFLGLSSKQIAPLRSIELVWSGVSSTNS